MLKNYLVTIFRQIQKNKVFTFINIFGLSLGMAACLVIAQYVHFHTSFDSHHTAGDRIFRIESNVYKEGTLLGESNTAPTLMGEVLRDQSSEVEEVARFYNYNYPNNSIIYTTDRGHQVNFEQAGVYIADAGVFELFDYPFVAGSSHTFNQPKKAILTLSALRKYAEDPQQAIGSTFELSGNTGSQEYEIIGVLEDLPSNSHIQFEVLLSYPSLDAYSIDRTSWANSSFITYLLTSDLGSKDKIHTHVNELHKEHAADSYTANGYVIDYFLRPLKDIHLKSEISWANGDGVHSKMIFLLSFIAMVILLIAWLNYMNLSLARTMERLKEMGIRKCMGSSMRQLTQLFVLEALVMNLLALSLSFILILTSKAYLTEVTGLPISALMNQEVLLFLIGLIVAGTLLIGMYPYALLKAINIVHVLVGNRGTIGGVKMRKSMVFVQFMITFILIAGTITVYYQINYMRNAELGIDIENILVINSPPGSINDKNRQDVKRFSTLKTELLKHANVREITNAGEIPGEPVGWRANLYLKNKPKEQSVTTGLISMDLDFPEFFDIDIIAGRGLRKGDDPWGRGDVVVNQKFTEMLGFSSPEDALGAELLGFYGPPLKVRGVLENHHHTSLHHDYFPMAYIVSSWTEYYFVKLQLDDTNPDSRSEQLGQLVSAIEFEWDQIFTDYSMDYFFLDQSFDAQYQEDIRFGKLFTGFSTLAILIACLGLFGLTSFTIQRRTKEIGIRKVLGATVQNLLMLLSREYILLVFISCIVSLPIAWWIMNQWLQDYTFRISLGWWFIIIPTGLVTGLALLSIMAKILSTVKTNPVHSLRTE